MSDDCIIDVQRATTDEQKKRKKIEELTLTPHDEAKKAVATVFREDATQLTADYLALSKRRLKMIEACYNNVERLNTKLFEGNQIERLSPKEALYAMSINLKAIGMLSVSAQDHKDTVQNLSVQINNIMRNDNEFASMEVESRRKIRDVVEFILKKMLKGQSDISLLNEAIEQSAEEDKLKDEKQK